MAHGIKIVKSRVFFLCYLKILIVTFFYSVVYDPNCEVLIFFLSFYQTNLGILIMQNPTTYIYGYNYGYYGLWN